MVFSIDRHEPPRNPFEKLYIIARTINGPNDFLHPEVKAIIEMFVDEGTLPVWVSHDGKKKPIYPFPELAEAIFESYRCNTPKPFGTSSRLAGAMGYKIIKPLGAYAGAAAEDFEASVLIVVCPDVLGYP